jgi:hypothetical protein
VIRKLPFFGYLAIAVFVAFVGFLDPVKPTGYGGLASVFVAGFAALPWTILAYMAIPLPATDSTNILFYVLCWVGIGANLLVLALVGWPRWPATLFQLRSKVPDLPAFGNALVGHLTTRQFLAFAVFVVIAMYGLWGMLSVWFYPLDDARIDIAVRELAGLARDRLLLRYSIIATAGAIGAGLVMWKACSRKRRNDDSHDRDAT